MLTRHSRGFLKFIRRSSVHFENGVVTFIHIHDHWDEPDHQVYAVIKYLEGQGYIRISYLGKSPVGIALTEPGQHPYQFSVEVFKSFLIRSVLTPIVVAFITTLITLWLS